MKNTAIVYHTFSGTGEVVADKLKEDLGIEDVELLRTKDPTPNMKGFCNWFCYILCKMVICGGCCGKKPTSEILELQLDLSKYDNIVIISPIHGGDVSFAMRTFIEQNKEMLCGKQLVYVQCSGGYSEKYKEPFIKRLGAYEKELIYGVVQGKGGMGGLVPWDEKKFLEQYAVVLETIKKGLSVEVEVSVEESVEEE